MTERLSPSVLAWALATISGLAYMACAIFFALAPQAALTFFQNMFHGLNLTLIAGQPLTFTNVVLGLIENVVIAALLGWLFGAFYNYFAREMK